MGDDDNNLPSCSGFYTYNYCCVFFVYYLRIVCNNIIHIYISAWGSNAIYIIISRADVRLCCGCCCRIPAKSKDYYCMYRDFQTTAADFGRSGPPSIVPSFRFSYKPPPIHPLNYALTAGALRFFFREFHIICLIL